MNQSDQKISWKYNACQKYKNIIYSKKISESIICRNDELSSTIGCLLKDSELFILFAENSQILLKIYVIPILLTFKYRTRATITRSWLETALEY